MKQSERLKPRMWKMVNQIQKPKNDTFHYQGINKACRSRVRYVVHTQVKLAALNQSKKARFLPAPFGIYPRSVPQECPTLYPMRLAIISRSPVPCSPPATNTVSPSSTDSTCSSLPRKKKESGHCSFYFEIQKKPTHHHILKDKRTENHAPPRESKRIRAKKEKRRGRGGGCKVKVKVKVK